MAFDLSDTQFTGPALPEPFVKFELENELTKLKLLPKTVGGEGKQLKEDWEAYRRHLAQLAVRGGPLRVRNHTIEPLRERLGYTGEIESADDVETREGREEGGYLLTTPDSAKLRVWTTDLDEDIDAPAKRGQAYRFSHLRIAQRVLLASGERVGLLTNGIELRLLISDPARPDSQVIFSLDPGWKRSRDIPDSFRLLLALITPAGVKAIPDLVDKARLQQARVTKDLRDQARQAIARFVQEVLDHTDNQEWMSGQKDRTALARALWHEGLIIVYRLLFVLKLESSDDPARSFTFASTSLWRNTFSPTMALARYAPQVLYDGAETGGLLEYGLRGLFRMFHEGVECTELNVKPLGGSLFGADATPVLSQLRWGERAVAHLLDQLLWTTPKKKSGARERVHYGPLDVEDLGRVYEALLELEPGIAIEPMCRLRRQKLEVVVPIAQGEKYRPAKPAVSDNDDEEDVDEPEEEEGDEDDSPKRGKKTTVQWIEGIDPGKFYLRVGLGRKATGSYYTPHSFVRFLVQETLGPQVAERSPPDDPQPCNILTLRVCDPACGSGHFLVESCRFLGQHLYEAVRLCDEKALAAERRAEAAKRNEDREGALAEAQKYRQRVIELPDPDGELLRYLPSRSVEGEQTGVSQRRAEAICRRMVAVHCLYAVDKNPLAVELAKLALWLESHAEGMPLTFLDHRIVVGDSLTGPFWEQMLSWPSKPKEKFKEGVYHHLETHLRSALFDALRHVRRLEATVGVSLAEVNDKAQAKAELDAALLPFRIAAAAWSGGVMLGPEHCDDAAYIELLEHIGTTHELPDVIESKALCSMIARGLGVDRSAAVPAASDVTQQEGAATAPLQPKGWHYRGYLPHCDAGGEVIQFLTFRLADSFPADRLEAWKQEMKSLPATAANAELRRRVEAYLDAGRGECLFRDPRLALLVQNALLFFHGQRYDLHAWVVMPNHVHVLFRLRRGHALSDVVQSWKSYTAKEANKLLHRHGRFWQEDYFDRYIRDDDDYGKCLAYIENNPVKAGLCQIASDWPYGSAGVPPAPNATGGTILDTPTIKDAAGTAALRTTDLCALLSSGRCTPALSFDLTFPEVFYPTGVPYQRQGFDVVVGNPPWDVVEVQLAELMAAFDPDFEGGRAGALEESLQRVAGNINAQQIITQATQRRDEFTRVMKAILDDARGGMDLYACFAARFLEVSGKMIGIVVPDAFHRNKEVSWLRKRLWSGQRLVRLAGFVNEKKLFSDLPGVVQFDLAVIDLRGTDGPAFAAAFRQTQDKVLFDHTLWSDYPWAFAYSASPVHLTLLEVRSTLDAQVCNSLYAGRSRLDSLFESWHVDLGQEVNKRAFGHYFVQLSSIAELAAVDPRTDDGFQSTIQIGLIPLLEGRSIQIHDILWAGEPHSHWNPVPTLALNLADNRQLVRAKLLQLRSRLRFFRLMARQTCGSPLTNERSAVFALAFPGISAIHSIIAESEPFSRPNVCALVLEGLLDTFTFDFVIRLQIGPNLSKFILETIPVPQSCDTIRPFVAHQTLRLVALHSRYRPLWCEQLGDTWREPTKSTFAWPVLAGEDERWAVRAAIDAVVADAYGLSRDQYAHVLSTFSHASYHKAPEICLARFDELKALGLEAFTRKHDPYWDIPLNENLPQPVIDLPIPGEAKEGDDGEFRMTGASKPAKRGRKTK